MPAPNPERIVELLAETRQLCDDIEAAFRWLHGATHAQQQRTGERVAGGSGPGSGGPTAAVGASGRGERTIAGRRVTTLHASTQDYCRGKLSEAGRLVRESTSALRGASRELARAFTAIDDEARRREPHGDPIPAQEEPWEIDRARGAQGRRTARGEVYAEDALPVPDVEYPRHRFVGKGLLCRDCGETRPHPAHDLEAA